MTTHSLSTATVFSLLDHQPDSVVYYTPVYNNDHPAIREVIDFEISYCNRKAALFTNTTTSNLLGKRVSNLKGTNENWHLLLFRQLHHLFQSATPCEDSYFNPESNRHFGVMHTKVDAGVLTVARDITNEVKEREAQKRQVELINSILDGSINGVFALEAIRDENNRIIDFCFIKINEQFAKVIGKTEEEIIGKSYLSILSPSRENGLFELKCKVVETGIPVRKDFRYKGVGIDGWFDISMFPLGQNGVVETFTDITQSKRDKEQLEQTAGRLETIVNTSKAGMFTLRPLKDDENNIVDFHFGLVNQAVASYIGQTAEVLKGALASIYFPAYKTNGLFDIYKDACENGTPYNFDFHYEDGYDVFFNIDVIKMEDEVLVTFTDHTTLKRLQRELEKVVEDLKRSNAKLEEFAYAASHDLKEPLRKIRFFADKLKEQFGEQLDRDGLHILNRLVISTDRMKLLVEDLLDYSQVSLQTRKQEDIDLNKKLQLILDDLELNIREKKAVVQLQKLPTIRGDRRQLQQLFHNLLTNALKYSKTGEHPFIQVTAKKVVGKEIGRNIPGIDPDKLFHWIEVADNGIGFEQQYADQIFNMFTRLHGKTEYSGTGVGLSIARKVVENHQGYIWATGELGKGATFHVVLPE